MAASPKKDNFDHIVATDAQRLMAARIAEERDREKVAKRQANIAKEELLETLGGKTDVTLVTDDGREVVTVRLVPAKTAPIDWKRFQAEQEWLAELIEEYRGELPEPTTRVETTWIETATAVARGAFQGFRTLLGR